MANPPRITDADIAVYGGTLSGFIEGLLEAVRTAPMEEKERAAGMLHALADQARENADTIGTKGLKQLIELASVGSHSAQAHACGSVSIIIRTNAEFATKASKLGALDPLAAILRTGTGAAQEQAAAAVASLSSAEENQEPLMKAGAVPALVHLLKPGNRAAAQLHAAQVCAPLNGHPKWRAGHRSWSARRTCARCRSA